MKPKGKLLWLILEFKTSINKMLVSVGRRSTSQILKDGEHPSNVQAFQLILE